MSGSGAVSSAQTFRSRLSARALMLERHNPISIICRRGIAALLSKAVVSSSLSITVVMGAGGRAALMKGLRGKMIKASTERLGLWF